MSHTARALDGPPPGVPLHTDRWFETDLAAICVEQRISPLIARSLESLTLSPTISRVTSARLSRHAHAVENESLRRQRVARTAVTAMAADKVDVLLFGSVLVAALYPSPGYRAINVIDILVHEEDALMVLASLEKVGFVCSGPSPLIPSVRRPLDTRAASDFVRYHHHFAPLSVVNAEGDRIQIHFRIMEIGGHNTGERAWQKRQLLPDEDLPVVCWEDQLIHASVSLGITGLQNLALVQDIGLILSRCQLDWGYVMARTRLQGLYTPFRFAVQYVQRSLKLPRTLDAAEPAPTVTTQVIDWLWRPERSNYESGISGSRFRYGFFFCGGVPTRTRWVWRHIVPRAAWVRSAFGRVTPWSCLKFLMLMRATYDIPVLGAFGTLLQRAGRGLRKR